METLLPLANLLIPLVIVAGVVAAVVAWRRREGLEGEAEADRGIGTVRRLYFYTGTFVYMLVAGVGVVLVADYVLDEAFGPPVLDRGPGQVAIGVVLAMIWVPVWLWHRNQVQRFAVEEPAERRSIVRKVHVYLTLGVTAGLVAHASVQLLRWVLGAASFDGYPVAAAVVWGGLWASHWIAESGEGQPTDETETVRRLYLYVTSGYSLGMLAVGLSFVIYVVMREAYDGLFSVPVLTRGDEGLWGETMKNPLAVAVVGGGLWAWHWFYAARHDVSSDLRQFYSYIFAIHGGVITVLSATGVILFVVLQWLIGTPEEATASAHFRLLPGAIAPFVVGLGLWLYHWSVVQQERAALGQLPATRRIYGYIMTALGLGALVAALNVLVATVIGLAITEAREVLVGADWWRDPITLVLTLALVGCPVWGYYWFAMQRRALIGGAEERASLPRRVLVFGVLGVGTLAILGNISYLLVVFLNALLEDTLSLTLLREAKWSIGALTAAVLIVPYYWLVLQEDRLVTGEAAPQAGAVRKSVTVLVAEGGNGFVRQLETVLGTKLRILHRVDPGAGVPEMSTNDLGRLERRVAEAAGSRVLVVADATGVQVYSYR